MTEMPVLNFNKVSVEETCIQQPYNQNKYDGVAKINLFSVITSPHKHAETARLLLSSRISNFFNKVKFFTTEAFVRCFHNFFLCSNEEAKLDFKAAL